MICLDLTAINIANKYTLYNYLSTFQRHALRDATGVDGEDHAEFLANFKKGPILKRARLIKVLQSLLREQICEAVLCGGPLCTRRAVTHAGRTVVHAAKKSGWDTGFNRGLTGTSTRREAFVGFTYLLPHRLWRRSGQAHEQN
jgi:hypothetical protein